MNTQLMIGILLPFLGTSLGAAILAGATIPVQAKAGNVQPLDAAFDTYAAIWRDHLA